MKMFNKAGIPCMIMLTLSTIIYANHRKPIAASGSGKAIASSYQTRKPDYQDTSKHSTATGSNMIYGDSLPRLVSAQFTFTEGPAVDKHGNVFFTDQPNNKIWKYGTDGKLSVFLDNAGRSNGMYFDKKGNLISCADEKNELWSISPSGKVTVLLTDFKGHRLNGPNDLWIHPSGGIYFTDPYYQRSYWDRKAPDLDGQKLYFLPRGTKEALIVDSSLLQPNGIIGSPDGKFLFVADLKDNKTYKYTIGKNGQLTNRALFAPQGSDGMTIDQKGNIYLTGRGVTVYNPAGEKIAQIDVPEKWTGNVCFGGKSRNILFITASKGVYTLATKVKGVE